MKGLLRLALVDTDQRDLLAHAKSYIVDTTRKGEEYLFKKDQKHSPNSHQKRTPKVSAGGHGVVGLNSSCEKLHS